ncbi:MAG: glycosyltransferase [Burkholderiales bacterium]
MAQAELMFSVIIPAYNDPSGLDACLTALGAQSFPMHRFDAIVVDDGSTPPVANVVERFTGRMQLTYIRVPNRGPAVARNRGARIAKGRYLVFTDHDCVPTPHWLSALHEAFLAHPDCLLGGPKRNGLPDNVYSTAHQIASNYAERWFQTAPGATGYFTTNNVAIPREAFLRTGGFDEAFSFGHEDREFGVRWADHGLNSAWIPGVVVVHRHKLTLRSFLRQQFRYGAGAIDFRSSRGRASVPKKVRFEGLRFHLGLAAEPFRHHAGMRSLQLATLLVSAQAAYVAGVVVRAATVRRRPAD